MKESYQASATEKGRGRKEINSVMGKNNWQLPLRKAVQWAVDVAHDLWKTTKTPKQKFAGEVRGRWRAPQAGWIKCNTDGAFYPVLGQGMTGVVLRDQADNFEGGRAKWYPYDLDSLLMRLWLAEMAWL